MDSRTGIVFKLLATLCATLMLACVKGLEGAIPTGEVIFFRSFIALFPLLFWLRLQGGIVKNVRTKNVFGHLIRGCSGTGGMYFNYLALAYISLADATAISYSAPLFTVVMAAILLKEHVKSYRWIGIAVGLCGISVMMAPHLMSSSVLLHAPISGDHANLGNPSNLGDHAYLSDNSYLGVIFALAGAFCAATSNVQIRFLASSEKSGAIVFYFSLMTTVIGLASIVFGWTMPTTAQLFLLTGCGLMGGLAQIFVTLSLRYADASLLAPFDYTTLIWSMIIGFFIWHNLPSLFTIFGALSIALSGLFIVWRDGKSKTGKQKIIKRLANSQR